MLRYKDENCGVTGKGQEMRSVVPKETRVLPPTSLSSFVLSFVFLSRTTMLNIPCSPNAVLFCKTKSRETCSGKDQRAHIVDLVSHMVSSVVTQLCHPSTEAATGNMGTNECGRVNKTLFRDTEIRISSNFCVSQISPFFDFGQSVKNIVTILSSWVTQKQVPGYGGHGSLVLAPFDTDTEVREPVLRDRWRLNVSPPCQ